MTRSDIYSNAVEMFYKKLPVFCDTLTPKQLENLELDLLRDATPDNIYTVTIRANIVREAGIRNYGSDYFL